MWFFIKKIKPFKWELPQPSNPKVVCLPENAPNLSSSVPMEGDRSPALFKVQSLYLSLWFPSPTSFSLCIPFVPLSPVSCLNWLTCVFTFVLVYLTLNKVKGKIPFLIPFIPVTSCQSFSSPWQSKFKKSCLLAFFISTPQQLLSPTTPLLLKPSVIFTALF